MPTDQLAALCLGTARAKRSALTVPYIERLDRPQNPTIADVEELVREVAARLSERMCFTGHNDLQ